MKCRENEVTSFIVRRRENLTKLTKTMSNPPQRNRKHQPPLVQIVLSLSCYLPALNWKLPEGRNSILLLLLHFLNLSANYRDWHIVNIHLIFKQINHLLKCKKNLKGAEEIGAKDNK